MTDQLFCTFFLARLDNPAFSKFSQQIKPGRLLLLGTLRYVKVIKPFSASMRRLDMTPSGTKMTKEVVAVSSFLELCCGRYNQQAQFEPEKKNQCSGTRYLSSKHLNCGRFCPNPPGTFGYEDEDPKFYRDLKAVLTPIIATLIDKHQASKSMEEGLSTRNSWSRGAIGELSSSSIPFQICVVYFVGTLAVNARTPPKRTRMVKAALYMALVMSIIASTVLPRLEWNSASFKS